MSYSFDGVNDKITYQHISLFDNPEDKCSISFWVKPDATPTTGWAFMLSQQASNSLNGWVIQHYSSEETYPAFHFRNNTTDPFQYKVNALSAGSWSHVFVTYDGSQSAENRVKAWVNGTSLAPLNGTQYSSSTLGTTTVDFEIGARGSELWWKGKIAEVAMWIGEAITDEATVIDLLAGGDNPEAVKNTGLDFYAPLKANATDRKSLVSVTSNTATLDTDDHPSVDDPPAAGATFTPRESTTYTTF